MAIQHKRSPVDRLAASTEAYGDMIIATLLVIFGVLLVIGIGLLLFYASNGPNTTIPINPPLGPIPNL